MIRYLLIAALLLISGCGSTVRKPLHLRLPHPMTAPMIWRMK